MLYDQIFAWTFLVFTATLCTNLFLKLKSKHETISCKMYHIYNQENVTGNELQSSTSAFRTIVAHRNTYLKWCTPSFHDINNENRINDICSLLTDWLYQMSHIRTPFAHTIHFHSFGIRSCCVAGELISRLIFNL